MSFIGGDRSIDAFIRCRRPDRGRDDPGLVIAGEPLIAQSNPHVVRMERRGEIEITSPGTDRDYSRPAKDSKGARFWLSSSTATSPSLSQSPIPHFHWQFATLEDRPTLIHSIITVNRFTELHFPFIGAVWSFWMVYLVSFYHFAVYREDHAPLERISDD
jgi:hypothetical protein